MITNDNIKETRSKEDSVSKDFVKINLGIFLEKFVPVLGSYKGKRLRFLQKISSILQDSGYIPIRMDKMKKPDFDTARHKLHTYLSTSCFAIVDDSTPSGAIVELEYSRNVGAITVILRPKGKKSSWMTLDFEIHSLDFKSFDYERENMRELGNLFKGKVFKWIEKRKIDRRKQFKSLERRYKFVK